MSKKHPIIAVTGSSGAGTSTVKVAFEHIFRREGITPAVIEGDSFHRYNRDEMKAALKEAAISGRTISHFGPDGNLFDRLEALFSSYASSGTGQRRFYVHDEEEAARYNREPGTFTEWEDIPPGTDLLFYEGLHGGVITDAVDIAQYVDLLIGVVPIVNLEWIQKIQRDTSMRGYTAEAVTETILRRMPDYVHYITPQFSRTHINFQRVPLVDTSNPFVAREVPSTNESFVVVRFQRYKHVDFPYLMSMLQGSFMSLHDTLVVPGGKMGMAMEIILMPLIEELMQRRLQ